MNNNVVHVVRPAVIRESRCENCENVHRVGEDWTCRGDIPKVFVLSVLNNGQPVVIGAWPPVTATDWCAHYKRGIIK